MSIQIKTVRSAARTLKRCPRSRRRSASRRVAGGAGLGGRNIRPPGNWPQATFGWWPPLHSVEQRIRADAALLLDDLLLQRSTCATLSAQLRSTRAAHDFRDDSAGSTSESSVGHVAVVAPLRSARRSTSPRSAHCKQVSVLTRLPPRSAPSHR